MNKKLIEEWIRENGPYGQEKLAVRAQIGFDTVGSTKRGRVPARAYLRRKLAEAIGVAEDTLFPPLARGKGNRAS